MIVSGPAGAGKSTTPGLLARRFARSAHIQGDHIDHMVVGGHEPPWLSEAHTGLIWLNMLSLTRHYLDHGYDVIIDYVAFWRNAVQVPEALADRYVVDTTTWTAEQAVETLLGDDRFLVRG